MESDEFIYCECDDFDNFEKTYNSLSVLAKTRGIIVTPKQFAICPYCGGSLSRKHNSTNEGEEE